MDIQKLFPLPPKYIFQNELPKGLLGNSALFLNREDRNLFLCKSVEKRQIGSADQCQHFKSTLNQINAVQNKSILGYTEIIDVDDRILLIRPYFNKLPLTESLCQTSKTIDQDELLNAWKKVCQSVESLHSCHLFPNMIKPSNIFLMNDKSIIVTDLYPPPSDIDTMIHSLNAFTVGFLAPEFFNQSKLGIFSDLWLLGIFLYFMITHTLPWKTKNLFTMLQQMNSGVLQFSSPITPEIQAIIQSLVNLDTSQRVLPNIHLLNIQSNQSQPPLPPNPLPRNVSLRLSNAGFLVLKDSTKTSGNNIRSTTTQLLQNNGSKGQSPLLLRTRQFAKPTVNSAHFRPVNLQGSLANAAATQHNSSTFRLPSFNNLD